jgi:hypothetical protein
MTDRVLEQIERTVTAISNAVADHHRRVNRQRARVAELEREGHPDLADHAKSALKLMEEFLERGRRELAEAECRRQERRTSQQNTLSKDGD